MVFKIALRKTRSCLSREQSGTVALQQNETKYFSFSKVNFDVAVMSSFYVAIAIVNGESDKIVIACTTRLAYTYYTYFTHMSYYK
jgi:hypothetical protein